jgi:hypothetical protein
LPLKSKQFPTKNINFDIFFTPCFIFQANTQQTSIFALLKTVRNFTCQTFLKKMFGDGHLPLQVALLFLPADMLICPLPPIAHCPLPIAAQRFAHCLLPIAHCPLPCSDLPIAYCPFIAHCSAAICPLPIAHCLLQRSDLPIAHCLLQRSDLPIAHCPLPCSDLPIAHSLPIAF